eukprot:6176553-Pleurochrysis_carterae.AAC.1
MPAKTRIAQFPEQTLVPLNGQIYCSSCKEVVRNIKQTLRVHVASKKHARNVVCYTQQKDDDNSLQNKIEKYY